MESRSALEFVLYSYEVLILPFVHQNTEMICKISMSINRLDKFSLEKSKSKDRDGEFTKIHENQSSASGRSIPWLS